MEAIWADSADKHGIDREDSLHAMMHAYYVESEFGEPRPQPADGRLSTSGRLASSAARYSR